MRGERGNSRYLIFLKSATSDLGVQNLNPPHFHRFTLFNFLKIRGKSATSDLGVQNLNPPHFHRFSFHSIPFLVDLGSTALEGYMQDETKYELLVA
jgi:hypothetical protein